MWIVLVITCVIITYLTATKHLATHQPNCHCNTSCNLDGSCLNGGVCTKGWFGWKCQYKDMATSDYVQTHLNVHLTDRNDHSCLSTQTNTVIITWTTSFIFTWLRIVVMNTDLLFSFDLEFRANQTSQTKLGCERKKVNLFDAKQLDIKCELEQAIQGLTITGDGVQSLCSLYINGDCDILKTDGACHYDCKNCHLNDCDFRNGLCTSGCDGYRNFPFCNETCLPGFHGFDCTKNCSNCFENNCDHSTQMCTDGCFGFENPPTCTVPCNGSYGYNCLCKSNCQECEYKSDKCKTCNLGLELDTQLKYCRQVTWFGDQNQYQCHCTTRCNVDGFCESNGTCTHGWFGWKCQYQDLATRGNLNTELNENLTDRNDSSCWYTQTETLTISWNISFIFTWLRIVVYNPELLAKIDVEFLSDSTLLTRLECSNRTLHLINPTTLDIKCEVKEAIQLVTLTGAGVKSLCSLYINGGRNVALKQKTWQSSEYWHGKYIFSSDKAVDGNTNSDVWNLGCSHTKLAVDPFPRWNLSFSSPLQITKYVIYNRQDLGCRLIGFSLEAKGPYDQSFSYKDLTTTVQPVYTLLDPEKNVITRVSIITDHKAILKDKNDQTLTLCEVEAYGECLAGTYDLDCKPCPNANCSCHIDTGECNLVTCKNLTDTITDCMQGFYGDKCESPCPINCYNNTCNPVTGQCYTCKPGFLGLTCANECANLFWGRDCSQRCSSNCQIHSCDAKSGHCAKGCIDGFQPPDCIKFCNTGYFGKNCQDPCPLSCLNSSCTPVTGHCYLCLPGFQGPRCLNEFRYSKIYGYNINIYYIIAIVAIIVILVQHIFGAYYYFFRYKKRNSPSESE